MSPCATMHCSALNPLTQLGAPDALQQQQRRVQLCLLQESTYVEAQLKQLARARHGGDAGADVALYRHELAEAVRAVQQGRSGGLEEGRGGQWVVAVIAVSAVKASAWDAYAWVMMNFTSREVKACTRAGT